MFARIGRFSARNRWAIIVGWVTLAVLITLVAPRMEDIASSDTADFLPANAPYAQGFEQMQTYFPGENTTGSAVIAIEVPEGTVRDGEAWAFMATLTNWLETGEVSAVITDLMSPASGMPLVADSLIAPDGRLALITMSLSSDILDDSTANTIRTIEDYLGANTPAGVKTYLTGNSPIYSGYSRSALESVDRTLIVTIVLVILLLLAVYRSPVSPLVPLITVTLVYLISRGIIAWLGTWLITVITYTNVLLVVILYGAGTDYCLFLISRFREEMADVPVGENGAATRSATARTVTRVGETIASSAGTVIVGFVAMAFAEMGLFNTSGPALALGVIIMLAAGLTLTPAILSVMGSRTFWPGRATHQEASSRLYAWISQHVSRSPVLTIVLIAAVLVPLAIYGAGVQTTYNMLADLPASNEAWQGFAAIEDHMGAGQIQTVNVVLSDLDPQRALAEVARWTDTLRGVAGVADVRSISNPLGAQNGQTLTDITSVHRQLTLAADLLAEATGDGGLPAGALTPQTLQLALSAMPAVTDYLNTLEGMDPALADNADLQAIRSTLATLPAAALTGGLSGSLAALQTHLSALAGTFASVENAYYFPGQLPEALNTALSSAMPALQGQDPLQMLAGRYLTDDRTAARLEVILAVNPYGDEATNVIRSLRSIVPNGVRAVSGLPTVMTDLRDTMDRDMFRSFSLVLLGIFVVLVLLLRALISPVYLILTILLSYAATMGITRLASVLLFGTTALTWWAPFFIFVMLIALGMDYNIFLMGRVKEEVARHGMREGVHRAVAATGPIITSAGIIMAGTFAAMMAGTVTGLKQLGLAVAVGVLLDTFVIRTALVPAIAVLLDHWNWWPGKTPRAVAASDSPDKIAPQQEHAPISPADR